MSGRVAVPGHANVDLAPYSEEYPQTGRTEEETVSRYLIVIEDAGANYSAYSPDLPGCATTGATVEETKRSMEGAMEFHLEGLREEGLPIPPPSSIAEYVEVS
jgi:predicted RNase H-like HicB family nuclease